MKNIVEKYDAQIQRILELLPGLLTWLMILSPVWLGLLAPQVVVYGLTLLTVYWVFSAFRHSYGMVAGYKLYKEEMAMNWAEKCRELDFSTLPDKLTLPASLNEVRHLILIPVVNEPHEILKDSVDSILAQTFPVNQIVFVYTVEEKYYEATSKTIADVFAGRESQLCKFLVYKHPAGIPGEAVGAGAANRAWGAKHAVDALIADHENIRNYIFSTIDADHVLDPQYIARLTHLYLSSDRRDYKFYSTAVHLFNNNRWRVPTVMRIEADAVTLGGMSDWVVAKRLTKDTFSSYSVSLQTLIDADYWDVSLGVDDTMFYWRAFFVRDGNFEGVPHFIPYSADAVEGKNYWNSYVSLYKQLLRWGWGVIDFPLSVKGFMTNNKVKLSTKMFWMIKHLEKRVILLNIVFLITFGFTIVTLVNPYVKQTNYAYSLPTIMSIMLTIPLVFFIPSSIIRLKIIKPIPADWPLYRRVLVWLEGPLIILNLLTFSFLPRLEAQTRMLLGKKMKDLYHTPKQR